MKIKFQMSQEQLEKIKRACRPVQYLVANGVEPMSPEQSANYAWMALGDEMGFDGMTAEPIDGHGAQFFMAEPKEPNHEQ